MKKFFSAIDGNDLISIIGLGMLGYGLYLFNLALALCVVGGILLGLGIIGMLRKGRGEGI